MTPDETRAAARLMLKFAADPTIQIECEPRYSADETSFQAIRGEPGWDWSRFRYREARKPIEAWLVVKTDGAVLSGVVYRNRKDAEAIYPSARVVMVREVKDEGDGE